MMRRVLVLVVCSMLFASVQFAMAEEYHFVRIEKLIEQEVGSHIIPRIYEKLSITVDITPLPGKRAQQSATSGESDGEIMRIFTYGEQNPTVVRVPTPYYQLETMAFINKDSNVVITSAEDLANYSVAKVRGVKHTDNITQGLTNVYEASSTEEMMRMLLAGRVEVALTNTVDGILVLKEMGCDTIVPLDEPLAVLDLFHYIHEDHKDLVDRVDSVLKEMKESGELDAVISEAEQMVIN